MKMWSYFIGDIVAPSVWGGHWWSCIAMTGYPNSDVFIVATTGDCDKFRKMGHDQNLH